MNTIKRILPLAMYLSFALSATATAATIKIAFIDPLSGPFAAVGQNSFNSWQYSATLANEGKWAGSDRFEVVGFDNKGSPQESLIQLKSAIDQGFRYIAQGNGSGVALALIDTVNKHNERNPGKEIVFLNYGANDPDLTNSKCSFWHFRFDANSDMKMEAITAYITTRPEVKKVHIIGQNFSFGHQVSRAAKEYLKRKRPDIAIVGDDLHPIGQVKDFSPYIAKIRASGADTVITGNWGTDLSLLIRAANDANLDVNFYTYYANTSGVPTAMGASGAERIKNIWYWNLNNEGFIGRDVAEGFKKRYKDDYIGMSTFSAITYLSKAVMEAKSIDPVPVAFALEGMTVQSLNGKVDMRKSDHQLQQPLYISTWTKTNGKDIRYDQENTGFGWKTNAKSDAFIAAQPTSCAMKRPTR
jgi:branched-chain amino acid transport system substrate-binding protein